MKKLEELSISPVPWEVRNILGHRVFGGNGVELCDGVFSVTDARFIAAMPKIYECLREAIEDRCHLCNMSEYERRRLCDQCIVADWKSALAEAAGENIGRSKP